VLIASLEEHPRAAGIRVALRLRQKTKKGFTTETKKAVSRRARKGAEKKEIRANGDFDFYFN